MPRYVTIKENKTFSRLYRKGKSYVSPVLVTPQEKRLATLSGVQGREE